MNNESMNLKDLWIGDQVLILSKDQPGKFEGMAGHNALVSANGKKYLVKADDITLYKQDTSGDALLDVEEHLDNIHFPSSFDSILDLHLEALDGYEQSRWPHALDYQLSRCKSFILKAIALKIQQVKIIHGKGEGVLKNGVESLLSSFDEVDKTTGVHDGGAIQVTMKYDS